MIGKLLGKAVGTVIVAPFIAIEEGAKAIDEAGKTIDRAVERAVGDDRWEAPVIATDVRELLDRAEASHRYGAHLIDSALNSVNVPPSRPRAIGLMACEHVEAATRGLVALELR